MSAAFGFTVLRTMRNPATKRWQWRDETQNWRKITYEAGWNFHTREVACSNFREMIVEAQEIMKDPQSLIVRGQLSPSTREALALKPDTVIRRQKLNRAGREAPLTAASRAWVMIDVDHYPLQSGMDLHEPELVIDALVYDVLPTEFHDAECFFQLSSSCGFVPGIVKAHLFFALKEPATDADIKAALRPYEVDCALFDPIQIHYVADPITEHAPDPLPRRTGWRKGTEDAAALPAPPPKSAAPKGDQKGAWSGTDGGSARLTELGDGPGLKGFHAPLRTATMAYARACLKRGIRDDQAFIEMLRDKIRAAPTQRDPIELAKYLEGGELHRLIEGAFRLDEPAEPEPSAMRPEYELPTMTLDAAEQRLEAEVDGFFARTIAWHELPEGNIGRAFPEKAGIKVVVGGGKTHRAIRALRHYVDTMKAAALPHRVLWLVPMHKLSDETAERMRKEGLSAAVLRGRLADDPDATPANADDRPKMCRRPEAVRVATDALASVRGAVCGGPGSKYGICPLFNLCSYQRGVANAVDADVVIAANTALFYQLDPEVMKNVGLVILDEGWWTAGLRTHKLRLSEFAQAPIDHPVMRTVTEAREVTPSEVPENSADQPQKYVWVKVKRMHAVDTNDLHVLSKRLRDALDALQDGSYLTKDALLKAGITAEMCADAEWKEFERKVDGIIHPKIEAHELDAAAEKTKGNREIIVRSAIWKECKELLQGRIDHDHPDPAHRDDEGNWHLAECTETGRIQVGTASFGKEDTKEKARAIFFHERKVVTEALSLPVLYMDATMPETIVRRFFPSFAVVAEVDALTPNMTVHQIFGPFGKADLVADKRAPEAEKQFKAKKAQEIEQFIKFHHSLSAGGQSGGNAAVITYMGIEELFDLPAKGHFNAIRGLDRFRDVSTMAIVGRPFPEERDLVSMAVQLTGKAIKDAGVRSEVRGALMADGTGRGIMVRGFDDPDVEAIRAAITDAEIIQAVGRVRGVRRTANDPVLVLLLAKVLTPLPLASLSTWPEVKLGPIETMLARHAALLSPMDAFAAFPDLFPSPDAARMAMARDGSEADFPNISLNSNSSLRDLFGKSILRLQYRPKGRGQQTRRALVLRQKLDGLRPWLQELLGDLTLFAVADGPNVESEIVK